MKSSLLFGLIFGFAINSVAQNKSVTKPAALQGSVQSKSNADSVVKPPRVATGPNSFGPLKLGMSKDAVEALSEKDGVFLSAPMSAYVYKYSTPTEGLDKFDAKFNSPVSNQPLEVVLSFRDDVLQTIYISFKDSNVAFEKVKSQLTEKYGLGKQENSRKEEQCIYKNGANFKITTGDISQVWVDAPSPSEQVQTKISDYLFSSCPSNLRYGSVSEINLRSLTIDRKTVVPEAQKPVNLF